MPLSPPRLPPLKDCSGRCMICFSKNQDHLGRDHLDHAEALGLYATRLIGEVIACTYAKHLQEDFHSGVRSGVNGPPIFFINGIRHDGSHDVESMITALAAVNR
jgi:hypothetical protein